MTDYEIKLMRNINKLNNFMEDKSIEYQDLTLELIEEFVLKEFKSSLIQDSGRKCSELQEFNSRKRE